MAMSPRKVRPFSSSRQTEGRSTVRQAKASTPQSLAGKRLVHPLYLRPFRSGDHAAVQQHIHGTLGDHHQSAGELMDRAHQLAIRVEGDFRQAGPAAAGQFLVKAILLSQPDQRRLRGIAHFPVFVDRGIAAQKRRAQQRLLNGVVKIRLAGRQ